MKISRLEISNFVGISEFKIDLGKLNILTGRVGSGKTSIIEAIEKGFSNKSQRVEVIRHGEDDATIFIKTDDGLEIDRKLRSNKADYLKVRKAGQAVPSTENFLKQFLKGDLFKPLEFCAKSPTEQAKIILNLLEIPWSMDDIANWFGEIPTDIDYDDQHILQVLGQIVKHYFSQREVVNREIGVIKAQVTGYKNELPKNYDGEEWRSKNVAEYYQAVSDAELLNKQRENAMNLIEGLEGRKARIMAEAETEKQTKRNEMNQTRHEIEEYRQETVHKIETLKRAIAQKDQTMEQSDNALNLELERKLLQIRDEYNLKKDRARQEIQAGVKDLEQQVVNYEKTIYGNDLELTSLQGVEENALRSICEKANERIKTEDARLESSRRLLDETAGVNVEPLKQAAAEVAHMQSFLRDYDLMTSLIREKLAPREELAKVLTARIDKGREMPRSLLKTAALPIPGLSVDGEGKIRIGKTLIDGLSEGEQLQLAFRVAKAQAGELKLICLDGWNKINPTERAWIEKEISEDDFQYVVVSTEDGDLAMNVSEGTVKEDVECSN
ncbi:MAG: AAA family ATPase [Bacillota bacterium]|nr:AAA family ATPase [Bacillota bacterium]